MADIIPFKRPRKPPNGSNTNSPWRLISIEAERDLFSVVAWTGAPGDPGVDRMYLGAASTLLDATAIARTKAHDLGVNELADFSSMHDDLPPESAA